MKKKIIIGILSLGLIVFIIAFVVKYQKVAHYKSTIATLPDVNLVDFALFKDAFYDEGTIDSFLIFNSECSFCLDEVEDIVDNIELFEHVNFYLVTNETEEHLKTYSEDSEFLGIENFTILKDDNEFFYNFFGKPVTPSIYVYSKDGNLIDYHNGFAPLHKLKPMIGEN